MSDESRPTFRGELVENCTLNRAGVKALIRRLKWIMGHFAEMAHYLGGPTRAAETRTGK